jgi:hypothetical protein
MSRLHHTGITPADAPGYAWRPLFFASITDTRLQYTRTRMGYHDGRVFPVNTIRVPRRSGSPGQHDFFGAISEQSRYLVRVRV